MNVYIKDGAMYCEDCAPKGADGPHADGGGEGDCPNHCDDCGVFLENPLTIYGQGYTTDMIKDARAKGRTESVALTEWLPFYDYLDVDGES